MTVPALLFVVLFAAVPGFADRLSPYDRERLEAGETLVAMVEVAGAPVREGVARRLLAASPERVFRAITDYAHYAEFMPFVTDSRAVGDQQWELSLDLPWPSPDERFLITAESQAGDGRWTSNWRLVPGSGEVLENRGDWTLEPYGPDRTLVTLRMRSHSGPPIPAGLQERATRDSLPWMLDGLRQHVGRCRYDEPRAATCTE